MNLTLEVADEEFDRVISEEYDLCPYCGDELREREECMECPVCGNREMF